MHTMSTFFAAFSSSLRVSLRLRSAMVYLMVGGIERR